MICMLGRKAPVGRNKRYSYIFKKNETEIRKRASKGEPLAHIAKDYKLSFFYLKGRGIKRVWLSDLVNKNEKEIKKLQQLGCTKHRIMQYFGWQNENLEKIPARVQRSGYLNKPVVEVLRFHELIKLGNTPSESSEELGWARCQALRYAKQQGYTWTPLQHIKVVSPIEDGRYKLNKAEQMVAKILKNKGRLSVLHGYGADFLLENEKRIVVESKTSWRYTALHSGILACLYARQLLGDIQETWIVFANAPTGDKLKSERSNIRYAKHFGVKLFTIVDGSLTSLPP